MDSLAELADRLVDAERVVTGAAAVLATLDPGSAAFGAGGPGQLGEIGRALHAQLTAAVGARSREAAAAGTRLADTAQAVRAAAAGYRAADEAAQSRSTGAGWGV